MKILNHRNHPTIISLPLFHPSYTSFSRNVSVEVAWQLENSDAGMVVTEPPLESVLTQALDRIRKKLPVFVNGVSQEGHADVRKLLDDPNVPFCELVEVREREGERGYKDSYIPNYIF